MWIAHSSSHKHNMAPPPSRPFLCVWGRCLLVSTSQLDGYLHLSFPHSAMNIAPNSQTSTLPLAAKTWSKRAIQSIPLLAGLAVTPGIGTGVGGIVSSTTSYHTLSKDFTDNIERAAKSLVALQDQTDYLAKMALQNRRGLDLLTAEKGGLCLFLNKDCRFYVN